MHRPDGPSQPDQPSQPSRPDQPDRPSWRTASIALATALLLALSALAGLVVVQQRGYAEDSAEVGFARDMYVHHDQAVVLSLLVRERGDDPEVAQLARDILTGQGEEKGVMLGWLREHGAPATTTVAPMAWMEAAAQTGADGGAHGGASGSGGHDSKGMGQMSAPTGSGAGGAGAGAPGGADSARTAMGMATDEQLSELGRLSAAEADLEYVRLMQRHHEGAVAMTEAFVGLSDEPTLSRLSEGVLTTQQRELTILAGMEERLAARVQAG